MNTHTDLDKDRMTVFSPPFLSVRKPNEVRNSISKCLSSSSVPFQIGISTDGSAKGLPLAEKVLIVWAKDKVYEMVIVLKFQRRCTGKHFWWNCWVGNWASAFEASIYTGKFNSHLYLKKHEGNSPCICFPCSLITCTSPQNISN